MANHNLSTPNAASSIRINPNPLVSIRKTQHWEDQAMLKITLGAIKALPAETVIEALQSGVGNDDLLMQFLHYHRNLTEIADSITDIQSRNTICLTPTGREG